MPDLITDGRFVQHSMKKILATILAFVYLSSSMGATIHLHYCMGKLASWGLIDHESKNCAQCGMVKKTSPSHRMTAKMDCCRDEHKQLKTDKDQKLSPAEFFKYNTGSQAIVLHQTALQYIPAFSVSIAYPNTHAPPLLDRLPLFVLYRNFRI
jgi:hypothetical protein